MRIRAGRLALTALAIVAVPAAAAFVAWLAVGPEGAARWVAAALRERGIPVRSLTIAGLGPTHARLEDVRLGPEDPDGGAVRIGAIEARFSPQRLIGEGRIDRLIVEGVRLPLRIGDDGAVTVPGLPVPDAGAGGLPDRLPALPADTVVLDDVTIRAETPVGPVTAALSGRIAAVPDGAALTAEGRVEHAEGAAGVGLEGRVARDWAFDAALSLADGHLDQGGVAAEGVSGWATLAGSPGGIDAGHAALEAARVAWPGGALADVSVAVRGDAAEGDLLVLARAAAAGGTARVSADAAVHGWRADRAEAAEARVDIAVAAADIAPLWPLPGESPLPPGRGALALSLAAPLDALLAAATGSAPPEAVPARGHVALRLEDVAVPETASDVTVDLSARYAAAHGVLTLSADRPWHVAATPADPGVPVALTVTPRGGPGAPLTVTRTGGATTLWLNAGLALETPPAAVSGTVRGRVALDAADGAEAPHVVVAEADLAAGPLVLDGLTVTPQAVRVSGAGTPDRFTARLAARLTASGEIADGVVVTGAAAGLDGTLRLADGVLWYEPADCLALSAEAVISESIALPEGLSLCLAAPDAPLVRAQVTGADAGAFAAAAVARPFAAVLDLGDARIALDVPRLALGARVPADPARTEVTVGLSDTDMRLPDGGFAADAMTAAMVLYPLAGGDTPVATFELTGGTLRPAPPAPFAALNTTGTGTVTGDGLTFTATGRGAGGALRVTARGDVAFTDGGGRIDFDVAPVSFGPDGPAPDAVFPVLTDLGLAATAGTVAARGHFGWGARRSRGAVVSLDGLGVATDLLEAAGVDGTLTLTSFAPVVMPPGQRLRIGVLDFGLLLEDGLAVFGLQGDRLTVSAVRFNWAGGQVSAEPFTVSLDDPDAEVVLAATGVDLGALMERLPLEGLSVTGRLAGRMPLRLTDDTIRFDDAQLSATEPGIIRYRADAPDLPEEQSEGVDLLLEALRNFHYDELALSLDGATGEDMDARLRLRGANPDLYGGYPFALTINVAGALERILRRSLATTRFAERVEEFYRDGGGEQTNDELLDELDVTRE